MSPKSFPLAILDAISGQVYKETTNFSGYLPERKEHFTLNKQDRYQVVGREFFYDADMKITAVELWVAKR